MRVKLLSKTHVVKSKASLKKVDMTPVITIMLEQAENTEQKI
jgi:hypothetical protein